MKRVKPVQECDHAATSLRGKHNEDATKIYS
jgi:hypothetical protein